MSRWPIVFTGCIDLKTIVLFSSSIVFMRCIDLKTIVLFSSSIVFTGCIDLKTIVLFSILMFSLKVLARTLVVNLHLVIKVVQQWLI